MKVSYKWLNEYLDLSNKTPEQLVSDESLGGIEVDGFDRRDEGMKKIVIGHTLSVKDHPDSDHLHICQVDVGEEEPIQIVCGAPNVAEDQYVIVALANSRIADNVKIKKGKMRGEVSDGMICGLQEIGFPENVVPKAYVNGIYVFEQPMPVGESVFPYLGMDDSVLDFEVTPNRPDVLGMHGAAYEVGAIYGQAPKFEKLELHETGDQVDQLIKSQVANKKDAPTYELRVLQDVTVRPSPLEVQIKLWNAGIRPINNIVDLTNLMMLTYDQPMHAYDLDKINGQIEVRRAQEYEKLTTLDGNNHELTQDDIVIADDSGAIGLAGVMGGLATEVTDQTKNVVLEAGIFDPTHVRKTAQHYNLRSEASSRFEKGINPDTVELALNMAASLSTQSANAKIAKSVVVASKFEAPLNVIEITLDRINKVLGTDLDVKIVSDVFDRLLFNYEEKNGKFTVTVPARRLDIHIQADLIEEVARLFGYDKLPSTLPVSQTTTGGLSETQKLLRQVRNNLKSVGMTETINYSLTTEEKSTAFAMEPSEITALQWPMTKDHAFLRMNLVSGLLDAVSYNLARKQSDLAIYEQGRVFLKDDQNQTRPNEVEYVAGAFTGNLWPKQWPNDQKSYDFYYVKGIVEELLSHFNFANPIRFEATDEIEQMHPGRTANVFVGDRFIGFLGQVHPMVEKQLHINETYVFQLNLQTINELVKLPIVAKEAPKYPSVTRDIAILVDRDITNAAIETNIKQNGGAYLQSITLFDVYTGSHIDPKQKSLAYTLKYNNPNETLTEDVVNDAFEKVTKHLKVDLNAEIR